MLSILIAASLTFWYVEITSPNFPQPFKIAGGYSSKANCEAELPDIIAEWSAKTYSSGQKKGQNSFGAVSAVCKRQELGPA